MKAPAQRVMIIAGEASADQYGARVVRALRERAPDAQIFGIGGDLMAAEGVELLFHISQTAIMGFVEVAKNIVFLKRMLAECTAALRNRTPDIVLLIDYPGFNLRFAARARRAGVRVLYYISPQLWAWGKNRGTKMRKLVDQLAVVFPFEVQLYQRMNIPVSFVGHPLLEILEKHDREETLRKFDLPSDRPLLGLFPGSRKQEVDRLLPPMLEAAVSIRESSNCLPVIGAARLSDDVYRRHLSVHEDVPLLRNATHALMQHSRAAIVASGTATLETALYETPMLIVYKTSYLNYAIGKRLITIHDIGMVNILAGRRIVPELLQNEVTPENIAASILPLLADGEQRENTLRALRTVRHSLGSPGASERVAAMLLEMIDGNTAS